MRRFNLYVTLFLGSFFCFPTFAEKDKSALKNADVKVIRHDMPPLITSFIDPYYQQPTHNIVVLYSLELADDETKKEIKLWQKRLHDAILRSFNNYLQVIWEGKGELSSDHVGMFIHKVVTQLIQEERLKKVQITGLRIDRTVRNR